MGSSRRGWAGSAAAALILFTLATVRVHGARSLLQEDKAPPAGDGQVSPTGGGNGWDTASGAGQYCNLYEGDLASSCVWDDSARRCQCNCVPGYVNRLDGTGCEDMCAKYDGIGGTFSCWYDKSTERCQCSCFKGHVPRQDGKGCGKDASMTDDVCPAGQLLDDSMTCVDPCQGVNQANKRCDTSMINCPCICYEGYEEDYWGNCKAKDDGGEPVEPENCDKYVNYQISSCDWDYKLNRCQCSCMEGLVTSSNGKSCEDMCSKYDGTEGTIWCGYDMGAERCECSCLQGFFPRADGKGCAKDAAEAACHTSPSVGTTCRWDEATRECRCECDARYIKAQDEEGCVDMCTKYVGTNGTLSCEYDTVEERCDCECSPGFFLRPDGKGCTADAAMAACQPTSNFVSCSWNETSRECRCKCGAGYEVQPDGEGCVDMCDKYGRTEGTVWCLNRGAEPCDCTCYPGFFPRVDGKGCVEDAAEAACNTSPRKGTTCRWDEAARECQCECNAGYAKRENGAPCEDACKVNNGGCGEGAVCLHAADSSIECECAPGFRDLDWGPGTMCMPKSPPPPPPPPPYGSSSPPSHGPSYPPHHVPSLPSYGASVPPPYYDSHPSYPPTYPPS